MNRNTVNSHLPGGASQEPFRRATLTVVVRFAPTVFLGVLSGCAVIQSVTTEDSGHTHSGLVYSLPKGEVQLIAERKKIASADVKKAKDAADSTQADAER